MAQSNNDYAHYDRVQLRLRHVAPDRPEIQAALLTLGFDAFLVEDDTLIAYGPPEEIDPKAVQEFLRGCYGFMSDGMTLEPGKNWNALWENAYPPALIHHAGGTLAILAPFHKPDQKIKQRIIIHPGMAFGTAHHHTTALMLKMILEYPYVTGANVLDMGCGTGILGIAALKQGAAQLHAIDNDPIATESALQNLQLNHLNADIDTGGFELIDQTLNEYSLILCNITQNVILENAHILAQNLLQHPHARLMLSGFYDSDATEIQNAMACYGLITTRFLTSPDDDESYCWGALAFRHEHTEPKHPKTDAAYAIQSDPYGASF